jgi:hypothetical protein
MMKRVVLLFSSVALVSAAPPPTPSEPYAQLREIVAPISGTRMKQTVAKLVSFGTRHTLSSQTDPKRGIGAAQNWVKSEFESYSKACGNCLTIVTPEKSFTGDRSPKGVTVRDVVAIQRGTTDPNRVVIITGHLDSRVTDVMNSTSDAPGANDDGSGTAAVVEAARILSKHKFPATIVYGVLTGEEQGLYGGKTLAEYAKAQGWQVEAELNNDIIGNSCSSDGVCDDTHVRVLSEGVRGDATPALIARQRSLGGFNDAPSRNLSRFVDSLAGNLGMSLDVRQIWRTDRWGRGGDHIPFQELGYPAIRFTVAVENYNWQHQDLRTEKGVVYGDTIDHMDFDYLEKVTKLNAAALAAIASAPPTPEPEAHGAVSTDTTVSWNDQGSRIFVVHWRRTDSNNWQESRLVNLDRIESEARVKAAANAPPGAIILAEPGYGIVLPHIRVDDWVFGVSSVGANGFESPVASAVPGGEYKPYIDPVKKP